MYRHKCTGIYMKIIKTLKNIYKDECSLSSLLVFLQSKRYLRTFFVMSTWTFTSLSMCHGALVYSSWADMHEDMQIIENTTKVFTPLFLASGETVLPHQTIATVNGDPITLAELLAVHETSTFITSTSLPYSVDLLKEEYHFILQELITHALIRQEIEARGILVTEIDLQNAEREKRASYAMQDHLEMSRRHQENTRLYGEKAEALQKIDTFSDLLLEQGISLEDWRTMLARQVMKRVFLEQVIEPTILLQAEDIEAAYRAHPELLTLEKRVQCCLFHVNSRETAEAVLCALGQEEGDTIKSLENLNGYIVEDFLFSYDVLPEPWLNVVAKAEKALANSESVSIEEMEEASAMEEKELGYAEIMQEGASYKVLCIQKILPSRTLSLGEAYVRLERLLMEQRRAEAFTAWLEKAWRNAHIRMIPQLSLKEYHFFGKSEKQ